METMAQEFTVQLQESEPFGVALILAGVDKNGVALVLTESKRDIYRVRCGCHRCRKDDQVTEFLKKTISRRST